ncbi:MAG TPA: hypothetical protein VFP37_09290 [Steroidobacteraceae bacterium]|nr:hypothetical protein [Steroidobacteraceae bacterium]
MLSNSALQYNVSFGGTSSSFSTSSSSSQSFGLSFNGGESPTKGSAQNGRSFEMPGERSTDIFTNALAGIAMAAATGSPERNQEPDGKLGNAAAASPQHIDVRRARDSKTMPYGAKLFYEKHPEVRAQEELAWKRSLEVTHKEVAVWSFVKSGAPTIIRQKDANDGAVHVIFDDKELEPPPGYVLGSVWHSHPFNWVSGTTFYYGISRGPSIVDPEHPGRYTDAMMALKFPKTVFSLRALGYIGTGTNAQEWYYYGEAAVYGFGVEE